MYQRGDCAAMYAFAYRTVCVIRHLISTGTADDGFRLRVHGRLGKILLFVSVGKTFVAGAGFGMAALGVVDLAGTLGIQLLVDFSQHEHVVEYFSLGDGVVSTIYALVKMAGDTYVPILLAGMAGSFIALQDLHPYKPPVPPVEGPPAPAIP
ncbi:hypothetical protein QE361_002563 [Sphingomonas sp. SORGH_AS802]|jgi:hypothetical protein|uniref:hypothetical protein n=1 Tax=unclassified Sphingomonas TaxID=196159 RepID=UPI0028610A2A|nr:MULTISPECIES: hypothetical protein [unclassified Sphingomonas]MDR6128228.1 hypothetical protein [Sphingomonas sp. SORGH_AS_0438]MDR6135568.1 hypothetical protein [Sphingomonas sp. SORGH_AS_0802]